MFRDDVLEVRVRVGNMLGYLEFFVVSYFGTDFTEMVDFGHLVFFYRRRQADIAEEHTLLLRPLLSLQLNGF